ncbi:MAG TPA: Na+/H+ antiporter subunit E [Kiritimatiellia bacterium]|nr:Na+/H+ antiporter subunit E [Kiritimatiellia bacterium]
MKMFLNNILLAFLWAMFTGNINITSLLIGFIVGYIVLGSIHSRSGTSTYFTKVPQTIRFILFFLKEMVVSSIRVAYDVVTPTYYMRPGVIAIPLDTRTDMEIALLANVISLTPGTLSLDVSDDRKTLYIHAMFVDDPEKLRLETKDQMEKRLLAVMR